MDEACEHYEEHRNLRMYQLFSTNDGQVCFALAISDREWQEACDVLGEKLAIPPEKYEPWKQLLNRAKDLSECMGCLGNAIQSCSLEEFQALAKRADLVKSWCYFQSFLLFY